MEVGFISSVTLCLLSSIIVQSAAHYANITKRQVADRLVHSPLAPQSMYPDNPIMLESPSNFAVPKKLHSRYSIEEYIQGGYNKWGGYDKEIFQPDGSVILEYDMKISREEYTSYYSGNDQSLVQSAPPLDSPPPSRKPVNPEKKRFKRKALFSENTHWPGAIIPFEITRDFSSEESVTVRRAMRAWEERTCIRFVPAKPYHQNVLRVQSERGCNSFVGMVGGVQSLNLERDCRVEHVITHELGHVIGLIHEHQRPDRDSYIRIITQNVGFGKLKNFRKFRPERVSDYGVEYDYTSIMHYGKKAFSKNDAQVTMVTLDPRFQDIIGHTNTISFSDYKVVNLMYNCARACRSSSFECGKGYMDHNCHCVCYDGTDSCKKFVAPRDRFAVHRKMGRRFSNQRKILLPGIHNPFAGANNMFQGGITNPLMQPDKRNILFPGIDSPLIQTPNIFKNIFLPSTRHIEPFMSPFRNIFLSRKPPMYFSEPPARSRPRSTFRSRDRPPNQFQQQGYFDTSPVQQTIHVSKSPGFYQPLPYQQPHVNRATRIPVPTNSETRFQRKHSNPRTPAKTQLYPRYVQLYYNKK